MSISNAITRSRAWKLAAGTLVLAVAAGLAQSALARPTDGTPRAGGSAFGDMDGDLGGGMGAGPMGHGDHMDGMGRGPGMMGGGGRHAGRLLDSIGASAEQQAQLRKIHDDARTELKPLREAARSLHRQMQTLFAQPSVDANAVEALRQQLQAIREQASKRMTQAMLDASRVLTPEQRRKMAASIEQRRSLMQRHRAEREALEGGAPRRP